MWNVGFFLLFLSFSTSSASLSYKEIHGFLKIFFCSELGGKWLCVKAWVVWGTFQQLDYHIHFTPYSTQLSKRNSATTSTFPNLCSSKKKREKKLHWDKVSRKKRVKCPGPTQRVKLKKWTSFLSFGFGVCDRRLLQKKKSWRTDNALRL